ncbi:MAG: tetratricopeptide repeat protein [Blastocatellia bacterium]|nr:tetratricopeptide repeat protein [Blastocatellia bacterium]
MRDTYRLILFAAAALAFVSTAVPLRPTIAKPARRRATTPSPRATGGSRRNPKRLLPARLCLFRQARLWPRDCRLMTSRTVSIRKNAIAFCNRCFAYSRKSEHDRAIADCDQAIRLDQKYVYAYVNRGFAYQSKGDYDRAIVALT